MREVIVMIGILIVCGIVRGIFQGSVYWILGHFDINKELIISFSGFLSGWWTCLIFIGLTTYFKKE